MSKVFALWNTGSNGLGVTKDELSQSEEYSLKSDRPIVHVYTVCWNEQQMMPYFLKHYSSFAERIVVYDNMSTDATIDIVRRYGKAELRTFDTNGELNDHELRRIKNTAYKESRGEADFVIVVDVDEILYHPQLMKLLLQYKREGVTLAKTLGYDMMSWRFPVVDSNIETLVLLGRERSLYSKPCLFDPALEINFSLGAHKCEPVGEVVENSTRDILLLHFHYVGLLRCIRRHRQVKERMGAWYDTKSGVAQQFKWGAPRILSQFIANRLKANYVLSGRRSFISTLSAPALNVIDGLRRMALHRTFDNLK